MVPRVQAELVAGLLCEAQRRAECRADLPARPERAGEQHVPAIEARRLRAQHLHEEARLQQPKEMPAHVVRSKREEERRAYPVLRERLEQARHAFACAAKRVDVDAQAERAEAHGALLDDAFAAPVFARPGGASAGAASSRSM